MGFIKNRLNKSFNYRGISASWFEREEEYRLYKDTTEIGRATTKSWAKEVIDSYLLGRK